MLSKARIWILKRYWLSCKNDPNFIFIYCIVIQLIINNQLLIIRRETKKKCFAAENNISNSAAKHNFCIFAADYN